MMPKNSTLHSIVYLLKCCPIYQNRPNKLVVRTLQSQVGLPLCGHSRSFCSSYNALTDCTQALAVSAGDIAICAVDMEDPQLVQ